MAIIFNIGEALEKSRFNILREPIKMKLENEYEAFEKESMIGKLFAMETIDKYQQEYRTTGAFNNFQIAPDGSKRPLNENQEGYRKTVSSKIWKSEFRVTLQTIEDSEMSTVSKDVADFIKAYGRTRNDFAHAIFAGGLAGSITYDGEYFDTRGSDTTDGTIQGTPQTYFHNAHKMPGDNAPVQSNKFRASISLGTEGAEEKFLDVINIVETAMQDYTDDKGNILTIRPNRIIASNDAQLKKLILVSLRTDKTAAMGANAINIFTDSYELVFTPYLKKHTGFTDADKGFVMMDSRFNEEAFGAAFFERKPLEITDWVEEGDTIYKWGGRARFSAYFMDFRAMAYVSIKEFKVTEAANFAAACAATNSTPVLVGDASEKLDSEESF